MPSQRQPNRGGTETRVYTDKRYPDLEIHNDGTTRFIVFELNRKTGRYEEHETFKAHEHPEMDRVSEEFAARRAKAYFDRLSDEEVKVAAGGGGEEGGGLAVEEPPVQHPRFTMQAGQFNKPGPPLIEPVMTQDDVLDVYAKIQAMPDGPEKDRQMVQLKRMAAELNVEGLSLAQQLVAVLLEDVYV